MRVKKPRLEPVPEEPEYPPQVPEELLQPEPQEDIVSEEDPEELEFSEDTSLEEGPADEEDTNDDLEEQQPKFRDDEIIRSDGEEGGEMPARLQGLLFQLDVDESPTYHVRKVARPDYDEWCAVVSIYHDDRLWSTHGGQAFRSTRAEAVADAAWEAMTSLCHRHRRRLRGTGYEFYPHRESGTGNIVAPQVQQAVSHEATEHVVSHSVDLGRRLQSALSEINWLRNQLDAASTMVRDYGRWFAREAGEPVVPDARPWTPTSPCRMSRGDLSGEDNDDDSPHA